MPRFFAILFLLAAFVGTVCADPVITEFMASNQNSITDEDGSHSDWIEIYNPDNSAVNMNNWSLTDNATNLRKWIFPSVTIPAKGFLIVFASSKNRRVPGANLHTNFALGADGEYLGLIKPDGTTKATEFAPAFPEQFGDIAYGTSTSNTTAVLTGLGTATKAFVPPDASLGTSWRNLVFNDAAWTSGTLGVGFFNYNAGSNPDLSAQLGLDLKAQMGGQTRSAYVRIAFNIDNPAVVQSLKLRIKYDDGFTAFINGQSAAVSPSAPASPTFNSFATDFHNPDTVEVFDCSARIPQLVAGTNMLALQGFNISAGSSDFFLLPEIVVEVDSGAGITGYFTTTTPGAANGGPNTIRLPQTVSFSRPPGVFSSTFALSISGADSGQEIRYVIADPSGTGISVAEPTASSTLYTGAITISSSKLIRAAVFNPANGQKGSTSTVEYLQLETAAGSNNTSSFTSILPIAVLDTFGAGGPNGDTYKPSFLHIFEPVTGTASFNVAPTLTTRSGYHVRGSTSAGFDKKPYALETWDEGNSDLNISVLGLPKDSDWIWSNPWYYDDVLMHNAFIFDVSRQIGHWAPRTKFIETFTNTNGGKLDYNDYTGVYTFMEKIRVGSNRVDITKLDGNDITGDALTGGYLFKIDRSSGDEVNWHTNHELGYDNPPVVLVDPGAGEEAAAQVNYLKNYILTFETTVYNERSANFSTRNYRKYIDVPSWIDHHLLNSLAYNVDALRLSAYFHKDRNEKIKAGPIWDFDRALGSDDGRDWNPRSWNNIDYFFSMGWWGQLFQDPDFVQAWVDRWWELRQGRFSDANLNALVDQMVAQIGAAAGARDIAEYPDNNPESGSYLGEVAAMKAWLTSTTPGSLGRTNWIDSQLPAPPATATASAVVTAGTNVALSGSGTIRYTTNGTDPRPAGGGTVSTAATYGSPITINATTVLKARLRGSYNPLPHAIGTNWGPPLTRVYLVNEAFAVAGDLMVSEINYDPAAPTAAEKAAVLEVAATDFEYIELKNVGNRTVNTFEVKFADTMPVREIKLAPLTLAPGETALVVRNREAFVARYGTSFNARIVGEWVDGSLDNNGEHINLLARDGSTIQDFIYSDLASGGLSLNYAGGAWKNDVPSPGANGPGYTVWKNFYFPTGGAVSLDGADGDLDNAPNQREYADATNPTVAESHAGFDPVLGIVDAGATTNYTFTFKKPVNRPSAQYQPQKSADLATWTNVSDALISTSLGLETRAASGLFDNTTTPKYFFRLRTTITP